MMPSCNHMRATLAIISIDPQRKRSMYLTTNYLNAKELTITVITKYSINKIKMKINNSREDLSWGVMIF